MTLTTTTILLYLVALFLSVATLRPFPYATQTISLKERDPRSFLVLIIVVIPFAILIYFGLAFSISNRISEGAGWPTAMPSVLTFTQRLAAAVAYVGLSGWLWLRWRNPIAPPTRILGPVIIIAMAIIITIVAVIWAANHDQTF